MSHSSLRWVAVLESKDGQHIADLPFEPDLVPAERWAQFEHSLDCEGSFYTGSAAPVIEPVWHPDGQPPFVSAVRVRVDADSQRYSEFPISYFSDEISRRASALVESGRIQAGQRFDFRIYALRDNAGTQCDNSVKYSISQVPKCPQLIQADLAKYSADASAVSGGETGPARMPVFFSDQVLREATRSAASVREVETGGILVGNLCRNGSGRIFAHVTAQIPAEHTEATRESLRFTPESWVSADAAVALRGRGESILGWWHAHPWFCRHCPVDRRAVCPFSQPAFSAADRALHREVFQEAWNVALLLSFLGDFPPSLDLFAWQQGQIAQIELLRLPTDYDGGDTR